MTKAILFLTISCKNWAVKFMHWLGDVIQELYNYHKLNEPSSLYNHKTETG